MSYIVRWVKPKKRIFGQLKAVTTDGVHGLANCSFPVKWNGISRAFMPNEGKMFEVKNITWKDGYYELDPKDIIREIITSEEP